MDPPTRRSLAFLLSLGVIPLACTAGDGDDASAGSATTTGSSETTGSTGESETDSTASSCEARRLTMQECFPAPHPNDEDVARCEAKLVGIATLLGQDCADAREAVEACYAALTCAELLESGACHDAHVTADELCVIIPGATCLEYGEHVAMCDPSSSAAGAAQVCEYGRTYGEIQNGAACREAFDEYLACLSPLPCVEFEDPDACAEIDLSPCGL